MHRCPDSPTKNHFNRHRFLKKAWTEFPTLYSVLPVPRQWGVHAYYQPTKNLTETELREHRTSISNTRPHLAASASQDFERMYQAFRNAFYIAKGDERIFRRAIFAQVPASATSLAQCPQQNRGSDRICHSDC